MIGYIDVPDAKKQEIALSGIMVKNSGAPTLRRDFAAGEAVGLSFQVAQAKGESTEVAVLYLMKDELGQPIAKATVPHQRGAAGSRRRRLRHWRSLADWPRTLCRHDRGERWPTDCAARSAPQGALTALRNDAGTVLWKAEKEAPATPPSAIVLITND